MNIQLSAHSLSGHWSHRFKHSANPISALALPIIAAIDTTICLVLTCTVIPLIFLGKDHLRNTAAAILTLVRSIFYMFGCANKPTFDSTKPYLCYQPARPPIERVAVQPLRNQQQQLQAVPRLELHPNEPALFLPNALLVESASNYNVDSLKQLIEAGADPNATHNDQTSLIAAIQSPVKSERTEQVIKYLLEARANPSYGRAKLADGIQVSASFAALLKATEIGKQVAKMVLKEYQWEVANNEAIVFSGLPSDQQVEILTLLPQCETVKFNYALTKYLTDQQKEKVLSNLVRVIALGEKGSSVDNDFFKHFVDVAYQCSQSFLKPESLIQRFKLVGCYPVVVALYMHHFKLNEEPPKVLNELPEVLKLGIQERIWDAYRAAMPTILLNTELFELVLSYLLTVEGQKSKPATRLVPDQIVDSMSCEALPEALAPLISLEIEHEKFNEKLVELLTTNQVKASEDERYFIKQIYANSVVPGQYIVEIVMLEAFDLAEHEKVYNRVACLALNGEEINQLLKTLCLPK